MAKNNSSIKKEKSLKQKEKIKTENKTIAWRLNK